MSNLLTIASLNITCEGLPMIFPTASENKVTQIVTTFSKCGEDSCYLKHVITIVPYTPANDVIVEQYDNEVDALLAWTKLIKRMNPDYIIGYNLFGFELLYLHDRSKFLNCWDEFCKLGNDDGIMTMETKIHKSALGYREVNTFSINGKVLLDLYKYVQEKYKLQSYRFNYIVEHFKVKDNIPLILDTIDHSEYCNILMNVFNIFVDV